MNPLLKAYEEKAKRYIKNVYSDAKENIDGLFIMKMFY
jgi:hypothetical protein